MSEILSEGVLDPLNQMIHDKAKMLAQVAKEGDMHAAQDIHEGTIIELVNFLSEKPERLSALTEQFGIKPIPSSTNNPDASNRG